MKVKVAILGSQSLIVFMVSMDISNIEEEDICPVDFIIIDFRNIVLLLMLEMVCTAAESDYILCYLSLGNTISNTIFLKPLKTNLKQNEAWSICAESTHKGGN